MYNIETIELIHIELSNHCNSFCPQCPRYDTFGRLKKEIKLNHLTLKNIENIPISRMKNLKEIVLCGSLGDPLMNPDIDHIINYFKNQKIRISTNASLRNKQWWEKIAQYKNLTVTFCIDGIDSETHSRYRRNTSYEKIMNNAKTFISNNGRAEWQFIVFKHNQHQMDRAKELSSQLGFEKIRFTYSNRFDYNNRFPVYVNGEMKYNLEQSTLAHTTVREATNGKENEFYLKGMLKEKIPKIECQWAKAKQIYLSANGFVYPCCYIGYIEGEPKWDKDIFKKCIKNSYHLIDIKKNSLEKIINGPVYKSYFVESLKNKPNMICVTQCHPKFGKTILEQNLGD